MTVGKVLLLSKESSKCPTGSEALNPARLKGASVKLASKREDLQKKDFFLSGIAQITSPPYFQTDRKMAMDWMLDQTVDKEVKLLSKKFKGGNKKDGKGKG